MGDTKNITINLVAAGVANFVFTSGPAPVKSEYMEGETVYVKYTVKNNGTAAGAFEVNVTDRDTGQKSRVAYGTSLEPGYSFVTTGSHVNIGKMPNKQWNLSIAVTP